MSSKIAIAAAALTFAAAALAKLPPPDEATKQKAAEAAAKMAWQAKVDAYQLCKAQDAVAAKYRKSNGGAAAVKTSAPAQQAKAPQAAASKPQAAASGASAPQAAASGSSTPVTSSAPTPCSEPGPFAYNPPEQKPLETSGAHSPAGTAASPPSVRSESATMVPAKPGAPATAASSGKKS